MGSSHGTKRQGVLRIFGLEVVRREVDIRRGGPKDRGCFDDPDSCSRIDWVREHDERFADDGKSCYVPMNLVGPKIRVGRRNLSKRYWLHTTL